MLIFEFFFLGHKYLLACEETANPRIYKHLRNDVMHQAFTAEDGDWPSERKVLDIFYSEQFQLSSK